MRLPILSLLSLLACGGDPPGPGGATDSSEADWCGVREIFQSQCTACHSGEASSAELDLSEDPWAQLVGVGSATFPGTTLVVPGDPEGSLLYRKCAATQTASEGTAMPPNGGLGAAHLATLEAWIREEAPHTDCDGAIDTGEPFRYHPIDFADSAVHGSAARQQEEACISCHGADLSGGSSAVSCDDCHQEGWRTDCTYCHGGTDNTSGAPPRDIDDATDAASLSFSPHTAHVSDTALKDAFDCTACHASPTDVLSEGHLFVGDVTPGKAEVDFSGGLSPAGSWDGIDSCSNLYCHGNGRGDNGSAKVGDQFEDCASCHPHELSGSAAWMTMSGRHERHLSIDATFDCGDCHKAVVETWSPIKDTSLHVNGTISIAPVGTIVWDPATKTCSGECHLEEHVDREWIPPDP